MNDTGFHVGHLQPPNSLTNVFSDFIEHNKLESIVESARELPTNFDSVKDAFAAGEFSEGHRKDQRVVERKTLCTRGAGSLGLVESTLPCPTIARPLQSWMASMNGPPSLFNNAGTLHGQLSNSHRPSLNLHARGVEPHCPV